MQKLLWCNQQWMMRLSIDDLVERARPFIDEHSAKHGYTVPEEKLTAAVATMQERAQTLIEVAEKIAFYFVSPENFTLDPEASEKALQSRHVTPLSAYVDFLETLDEERFNAEALEPASKAWGVEYRPIFKEATGKKFKINQIFFPMRIALCGVGGGPGLFEVMEILGKATSIARLRNGIEICKGNG